MWDCWLYVEMNPVRARVVGDPADYRFCSFGEWAGTGRNPFAATVQQRVMPRLKGLFQIEDMEQLYQRMRGAFARAKTAEQRQSAEQVATPVAVAAEKEPFVTQLDRRVRYWVDGVVIGSELFVRDTPSSL